jgi:hypothetical protein
VKRWFCGGEGVSGDGIGEDEGEGEGLVREEVYIKRTVFVLSFCCFSWRAWMEM